MKIWGYSNAKLTEARLPIRVKRRADGRARMECILVHPRRPDLAGPLAIVDGPDADLHPRCLGPGARRLFWADKLAVAKLGSCDRVAAVHVFVLVVGTPPVDVASLWVVDGRLYMFCARILDKNHVGAGALRRYFVCQPRPGGIVRSRSDQHHAHAVSGDRSQRPVLITG